MAAAIYILCDILADAGLRRGVVWVWDGGWGPDGPCRAVLIGQARRARVLIGPVAAWLVVAAGAGEFASTSLGAARAFVAGRVAVLCTQ